MKALSIAGAVCAVAGLSSAAAAADVSSVVYPGPQITYNAVMDGNILSQKMHAALTLLVAKNADGTFSISQHNATSGADTKAQAKLGSDGTLTADKPVPVLFYTNDVASLLAAVPTNAQPGSTWKSTLGVITAPGSYLSVPVVATVAVKHGDQTEIQAVGDQDGSMSYSGMTFPVAVHCRASVVSSGNRVAKSLFEVTETMQSGGGNQQLQWTVALDAR
jgi:hypothetical protein